MKDNIIVETLNPLRFEQIWPWVLAIAALIGFLFVASNKGRAFLQSLFKNWMAKTQKDELLKKHDAELDDLKKQTSLILQMVQVSNEAHKNEIKTTIVREYNYFTRIGWIDLYSLDCIQRLFASYTALGGNTYIHDLAEKLGELPNLSPEESE